MSLQVKESFNSCTQCSSTCFDKLFVFFQYVWSPITQGTLMLFNTIHFRTISCKQLQIFYTILLTLHIYQATVNCSFCFRFSRIKHSFAVMKSLKPKHSLGKEWRKKKSLLGFIYRVLWIPKALSIILSETIFWAICKKKGGGKGNAPRIWHRFMYIAPSRIIHWPPSLCLLKWF